MAYYTFLSLLPLLLLGGFVLGTISVANIELRESLSAAIERLLPGAQGEDLVLQIINSRSAFGVLGGLTLAYAGSGCLGAVTASLNRMWSVESRRNPLGQKVLNFCVVLLVGIVLLGSVTATVWAAYVTRMLLGNSTVIAGWIELVASPLALLCALLLLYKMLPATRLSWVSQVPGAIFGVAGVEALKRAFAVWAEHSAGVSALPRSLISTVLLLVWMGLFAQVVLYGAAVNVVLSKRRRGLPVMPGKQTGP
jgi:membrane protein